MNLDSIQDFKTFFVKLSLLTLFMIYICVYIYIYFFKVGVEMVINKKGLNLLIHSKLIKEKGKQKITDRK